MVNAERVPLQHSTANSHNVEPRMETYYHPHDLGKFAEMGKGNKDLWEKFMPTTVPSSLKEP